MTIISRHLFENACSKHSMRQRAFKTQTLRVEDEPEDDDKAVEDVEAVADVSEEPVGRELEHHLEGEDDAEDQVAHLHVLRQPFWLHVELNSHAGDSKRKKLSRLLHLS